MRIPAEHTMADSGKRQDHSKCNLMLGCCALRRRKPIRIHGRSRQLQHRALRHTDELDDFVGFLFATTPMVTNSCVSVKGRKPMVAKS